MSTADLLIEIGTEELPPKFLNTLSNDFKGLIEAELQQAKLSFDACEVFAAPRRFGLLIKGLMDQQADYVNEKRGPAVSAGMKDGEPTKALLGFARGCGVDVSELQTVATDKGEWFAYTETISGQKTVDLVPQMLLHALNKLPIAKRMRWESNEFEFVRPVRWIVLLYGNDVIETEIMGVTSGRTTRGHRFHSEGSLTINAPSDYEALLLNDGKVMANFNDRKAAIVAQVEKATAQYGQAIMLPALLDEVTALVEWPVVLVGQFEEHFLDVPQEALISTMQDNQKYFPIVDKDGKLTRYFCFVSNIESENPQEVISGNERVIRPRFSDADFFWNSDKKIPLADYLPRLATTIFQTQLGSQKDKTDRVGALSAVIARSIGADVEITAQAASLYKSDLLSNMVQEFPELQGTMGRYYALEQGLDARTAHALEQVYWPKFAGDRLPESKEAQALAIAERLDTIVGIFAIGQIPTGSRDPYSLRRAALGILRISIEKEIDLDLKDLINVAFMNLPQALQKDDVEEKVLNYILERMKAYTAELGIAHDTFESISALDLNNPLDILRRLRAITAFRTTDAAHSLIQSNKRISNILTKNLKDQDAMTVDAALLQEDAEKALFAAISFIEPALKDAMQAHDYVATLSHLSTLAAPLDQFFTETMVMCDDLAVRENRLHLLNLIRQYFKNMADLSLLQDI
ncbi:glycine--tRNA ligase subunit beta [Wohlfahrtiimonas chitiniclastica]|uniref:glycine--tRNA ligase subunit beta n=1 Tax=Wohlfahrtiimonas chitiniclastica TaxID=400946 RepID=UPI000B97E6DB|nr:glycine--tRNA ligase subunit beta [Wohlfahrtiimonas chitiniclastica]OYQ69241.1 glycine--tRNA ligase subunit beta [Wohlfahrtiimonas chitiniclastica]OYQ78597.1 glycine--tRNA ligase subunit beta [Wohlfahrtiimonas chitiniclastica]OYQ82441.1 glycine--tRNA ligase subunit beta [Wohlfahrtiimonas chitiniclastica]OYQ83475.1 glycine--tRNA ligase subunit beta [Wohlfahrtiimonas chitiniclastica]